MRRGICIVALLCAVGCKDGNPVKPETIEAPLQKMELVGDVLYYVCYTQPRTYIRSDGVVLPEEIDSYYSYTPCPAVPIE